MYVHARTYIYIRTLYANTKVDREKGKWPNFGILYKQHSYWLRFVWSIQKLSGKCSRFFLFLLVLFFLFLVFFYFFSLYFSCFFSPSSFYIFFCCSSYSSSFCLCFFFFFFLICFFFLLLVVSSYSSVVPLLPPSVLFNFFFLFLFLFVFVLFFCCPPTFCSSSFVSSFPFLWEEGLIIVLFLSSSFKGSFLLW